MGPPRLREFAEEFRVNARLAEDIGLGALSQWVPIQWDDHGAGPAAELAVTSSGMHDGETGSLQSLDHFFAGQAGCTRVHAAPTVTSNEVTTGWADWSGMGASSK